MDVDHILRTLNDHGVDYPLIGGMNFLLRHAPVLTYDVDLWIHDVSENRARCAAALAALGACWGPSEADWQPVTDEPRWLERQPVFCLTSPSGAIDVFREVRGLGAWDASAGRAVQGLTATGVAYRGLADEDMIACQLALPEAERRPGRIETITQALRGRGEA